MNKPLFGVYPHAVWKVTDHSTGGGVVVETGGGLVVREISAGVPYGRMTPVKTYKSRAAAQKYVDKS